MKIWPNPTFNNQLGKYYNPEFHKKLIKTEKVGCFAVGPFTSATQLLHVVLTETEQNWVHKRTWKSLLNREFSKMVEFVHPSLKTLKRPCLAFTKWILLNIPFLSSVRSIFSNFGWLECQLCFLKYSNKHMHGSVCGGTVDCKLSICISYFGSGILHKPF